MWLSARTRRSLSLKSLTPGKGATRRPTSPLSRRSYCQAMDARVGDRVVIEGARVGQVRRFGEIVEVIDGGEGQHYRVHWDDGHESTFFPSSDAHFERSSTSP